MGVLLAVIGWTLFGLAIVAGLLLDLVGLFGNWVILAAVAAAWALTGFEYFTLWALVIMAALAALGEVLEALAAAYGAARFGGGKGAALAALAGGIAGGVAGTPVFPLVGTLLGACLGAFAGAALFELLITKRAPGASLQTGVGAALGRMGGVLAKLSVGLAMLAVAALSF